MELSISGLRPTLWATAILLAGCAPQPRAINTGPFLVVPCVLFCNTELAIEAIEDNDGGVTGGTQSQSIDAGEPELPTFQ